jgi:hypothetical protein
MMKQEAMKPGEKGSHHGFVACESIPLQFSGFHGFLAQILVSVVKGSSFKASRVI